jgi:hypothetical protein
MDIGVLIGVVACAVVLALKVDLSGSTVRTVGGMYHAPDLGWPHGVQEDDDMHWSWAAAPVTESRRALDRVRRSLPDPEPEVVDVESTPLDLICEPVHSRVRCGDGLVSA